MEQQLINNIEFNPADPYPLLADNSYTYEAAKNHSLKVDEWLGFPTAEAKKSQQSLVEAQTWSHLTTQQFQTPYCEIRNILAHLNPQPAESFVDLGCGYGRIAFVLARHYPHTSFFGYEIDSERVNKANERIQFHKIQNAQVILKDITENQFVIPQAHYYFLFDFGTLEAIQEILTRLQRKAFQQSITVVGRGRATRHYIQEKHPWLSQVNEPQHMPHYSIYKS